MASKNFRTLTRESECYQGNYVAIKSTQNKTIVSYGAKVEKVVEEATTLGYPDAIVLYIPKNNFLFCVGNL